jgi:hypothetical protein
MACRLAPRRRLRRLQAGASSCPRSPPVFDCAAAGLILSVFAKCNKCPKINDLRRYCDAQQAFFNGFSTVFQAFGLLDWRLPPRFCESAARTSAT